MKPIIRVQQTSKKFRLHSRRVPYNTLRDRIAESFRAPFNGRSRSAPASKEWLWALQNIDFDVMPGEVVGIIGRNGAGKSTLLKVLSRITEPTEGRVELYGRVGSLLEVGTGFHPELTGRENVHLNGAILGMTRREIQDRFDEIVTFAEVEKFLDTPVKHYSSGMYMRLAFAVAAHLETEILIVDEVLAVGDAAFQKKCLTKMGAAAMEGRTVLFVSHNLSAVRTLCGRAILIDHGKVELDSNVEAAITRYLTEHAASDAIIVWEPDAAPRTAEIRFVKAYILNNDGKFASRLDYRNPFTVAIEYEVLKPIRNLRIGFMLQTIDGTIVCGSNDAGVWSETTREPGRYFSHCTLPGNTLNAGTYVIAVGSDSPPSTGAFIPALPCLNFDIEVVAVETSSNRFLPGVIRPRLNWTVEKSAST